MPNIIRKNVEPAHDLIEITLSKDDYWSKYQKQLKEQAKLVNMPGFRPGLAPLHLVKKKYGTEIVADSVMKITQNVLFDYVEKENFALIVDPILLTKIDSNFFNVDDPKDYQFTFETAFRPKEIEITWPSTPIKKYHIIVDDKKVDDFIEESRKYEIPAMFFDEIVSSINFKYVNKEGKEQSIVFRTEELQDEYKKKLLGTKLDDTFSCTLKSLLHESSITPVIVKSIKEADESDDDAINKPITLLINLMRSPATMEIDTDFFNKIAPNKNIQSLSELKEHIRSEFEQLYEKLSTNQLHHSLEHFLMDIPLTFPENYLKTLLLTRYQQKEGNPLIKNEDFEKDFPKIIAQWKMTIIKEYLIEKNDIFVSEDELQQFALESAYELLNYYRESLSNDFIEPYLNKILNDEQERKKLRDKALEKKMYEDLSTRVVLDVVDITAEDFNADVKNHAHEHHHH